LTSDATRARLLGRTLADLAETPDELLAALRAAGTSESSTAAALRPVAETLARALDEGSPTLALSLAQRLAVEPARDARLIALRVLRRPLAADPERAWQLLRRIGREADDPALQPALADLLARGVLAERFRWAELEQLVYSDRAHERALVGAAIARIPAVLPRAARASWDPAPALALIGELIGDADPLVRRSLARALRVAARQDPGVAGAWLAAEAELAAEGPDANRAVVVRQALTALPDRPAAAIRVRIAGVRRRPGPPSTSRAAAIANRFGLAAHADRAISQQGERFLGRGA